MAGSPWGGSEELWSQTALKLTGAGLSIAASVNYWAPLHPRVQGLIQRGIRVDVRPNRFSLPQRLLQKVMNGEKPASIEHIEKFIRAEQPALVVISNGSALPPIEIAEFCKYKRIPFATIAQANDVLSWPEDNLAQRYREVLPAARRCYFVSKANWHLAEMQIADEIRNGELIYNPFNVGFIAGLKWPDNGSSDQLRFACVARLHPPSKGQDLLFEALALPEWKNRNWHLALYGEGPMKVGLDRLAERLGLAGKISFEGFRAVEEIWSSNHVLVMPSRYEGLPLAIVEAMICGRPVIATDIAGHREVVADGLTGFLARAPTVPHIADALERFWFHRRDAERLGGAGAERIRERVPSDPAEVFAQKLVQLI